MEENQLWSLIAKKLSGEASPAELALLDELLAKDGEAAIRSEIASKIWKQLMEIPGATGQAKTWDNINAIIQQDPIIQRDSILQRDAIIQQKNTIIQHDLASANAARQQIRLVNNKWLAAASIVSLFFIAGLLYYFNRNTTLVPPDLAGHEIVTQNGSRTEMILPDGSTVILNAGSRISYNKGFGINNRMLTISGEAFFDITHNPELPFSVVAKEGTIRVLGTAFNVRAYPDEAVFETSLLRGKIELELAGSPGRIITLQPMEKIRVISRPVPASTSNTGDKKQPYTITVIENKLQDTFQLEEVSWIKHKYVFRGESFDMLAGKIERWYGIKLSFEDPSIKQKIFTGVFDDLSLEEALKALVFSSNNGFTYTIANNEVIIKK